MRNEAIPLAIRQAEMRSRLADFPLPEQPASAATQRHFSVREVACLWGLGPDAVRDLFMKEPGVLVIGHERSRNKRAYRTLRIPESVVQRVHRRLSRP